MDERIFIAQKKGSLGTLEDENFAKGVLAIRQLVWKLIFISKLSLLSP